MKERLCAILLALSAAPALATAPKTVETDYEGKGRYTKVSGEFTAR